MKFVLTDAQGNRIGYPMSSRKDIRQVARSHVRAGKAVMIFLSDDTGNIKTYSSVDTAAAYRNRGQGRYRAG